MCLWEDSCLFQLSFEDEFRTSKLNYKTEEICEHLLYTDKKGTIRELHSVQMYQTEKGNSG